MRFSVCQGSNGRSTWVIGGSRGTGTAFRMRASCSRANSCGGHSQLPSLRSAWTLRLRSGQAREGARPHTSRASSLEQRRWSPLPALAFLFRDVFDVVHVGAGLRQDVVQVVADADEGETLFEELADARCPEQEDAENGVVLAGVID